MKKHQFTILVLAIIFAATAIVGKAQTCPPLTAGCLDTTFGSGGTTITNINGWSNVGGLFKTLIQSDGKILDLRDVHGEGISGITNILMRYNADGLLNTSFDVDGKVSTPVRSGNDETRAMAIQTDGKIVLAGTSRIGTK